MTVAENPIPDPHRRPSRTDEPSRVRLAGDGHHHAVKDLEPRGDRVIVRTYCGIAVDIVLTYAAQGGIGPCSECRAEQERDRKWWPGQG